MEDGTHHGTVKRETRSRDGQTWDPNGGSGVNPKQHGGESGSTGKLATPKASSGSKSEPTAAKS